MAKNCKLIKISVVDPNPEPDPYVFRPSGSGSISRGADSDSAPFSHKCLEWTEILIDKMRLLTQNFNKKLYCIFKTEDDVPVGEFKKNSKKYIFLHH
jgi:hypothetical protein